MQHLSNTPHLYDNYISLIDMDYMVQCLYCQLYIFNYGDKLLLYVLLVLENGVYKLDTHRLLIR
jgi:hypothetical protein